ncbi:MAG TPA: transglycosylase SLT domain-containing protein [Terriglobales bacterium]|jgi:membrane-bound lytic murein transglycosylase D|nr:transglycosylase SLT domain-containing protein [Terriglobales bacterium]
MLSDPIVEEETLPPALPAPATRKPERAEIKERTVPAKPAPAPPAQQAFGADNRLLDLLERDLDKAVESKERRRLQFSKEVVNNPKVRHFIKYYSTTARRSFQELLARSGKYLPMISKVLSQEGLPEEFAYLALLESNFIVTTISPSGAVGLWQFVPTTARQYGLRIDEWVDERRDPVKSTRAAAAYLKDLHQYFGRWYVTTAAYNAGQGAIDRAMQSSGAKDFWSLSEKARLTDETRNFVPKFVAIALIASEPEKYGLGSILYAAPLDYEEVELPRPMKLESIAELADSDTSTIQELNPALLRSTTPPAERPFRINLPVGRSTVYLARLNERVKEKESDASQVVTYEVRRGDTLFSIARYFGQEVRALMEFNGLTTARLSIGQKLRIVLDGIRGTLR